MNKKTHGGTLARFLCFIALISFCFFASYCLLEKRKIERTADSICDFLNFASAEASRLHVPIYVNFMANETIPEQWAVGLSFSSDCNPLLENNSCSLSNNASSKNPLVLEKNVYGISISSIEFGGNRTETCFEPIHRKAIDKKGSFADGSLRLSSYSRRFEIDVKVTLDGRVLICRPSSFSLFSMLQDPEC